MIRLANLPDLLQHPSSALHRKQNYAAYQDTTKLMNTRGTVQYINRSTPGDQVVGASGKRAAIYCLTRSGN